MIPAAAYYRMSSDQQEASISDQREAVEKMAATNGFRIVEEYVDEAISGWRDDRKAFQRLIADAPLGKFKAVLCWDQDRFSRFPVLEANHYWFVLDRAGVQLITVAQGRLDFSTLAGWLTASIAQHGKSEYCRDLARNTTRGLRKRKLAGEWVGKAPLGYVIENGRLALGDQAEIATVQAIFRMRASGSGYLAIAKHLNQQGTPTPRGARWSQFTVKHVLQRDAYLGTVVIGKHARAKYERLTEGIVTIENAHPAIITQETWDTCRAVDRQLHKAHTRNGSEGAPLAGLLYCGCCGSTMYAIKQGNSRYYICGSYHCHGECGRCAMPQDAANRLILAVVRKAFYLDDLTRLKEAISKKLKAREAATSTSDRASNAKQIEVLDRKIANAVERLVTVSPSLVPALEAKLLDLQTEREQLAREAKAVIQERPKITIDDAMQKLSSIATILQGGSPSAIRASLSQVIQCVRFKFEQIPGKKRRFRPTGANVHFFTKDCQHSERMSLLCTSALLDIPATIRISREQILAA